MSLRSLLDAVDQEDSPQEDSPQQALNSTELELHNMLSFRSATTPRGATVQSQNTTSFRKIGAGACGAIFASDGKSVVLKLAKTNDDQSLWNDYGMHKSIADEFRNWGYTEVRVPQCHYFIPRDDPHYFGQNPKLVEAASQVCNLPTSALVTERIVPLPKAIRTLLIEKYCPSQGKQAALNDVANKDCLVRVYLGSLQGRSQGRFSSLRNFKMHLKQMVELQLDINMIASRMATAMAIMHWAAKTDGRDVEFVLGSSSKKAVAELSGKDIRNLPEPIYTGPASYIHEDFFTRTIDLWLLDFNQVQPITMDEAGVAKAVEAVKLNDPYFPKPLQGSKVEKLLWNMFVQQYLTAAHMILREEANYEETSLLPSKFISGLIDLERKKQQK